MAPACRRGFVAAFTRKLLTVLREGYGAGAAAGLAVAIVALPLWMAIAIASGLAPERGLFAAIVGGVLVSALGGSRLQIGGPAGAFIVVVAACAQRHGAERMLLATAMSGVMLMALALRLAGSEPGPFLDKAPAPWAAPASRIPPMRARPTRPTRTARSPRCA